MATAIDQNRSVPVAEQFWYLIAPVAGMAKAAMQQDYR